MMSQSRKLAVGEIHSRCHVGNAGETLRAESMCRGRVDTDCVIAQFCEDGCA